MLIIVRIVVLFLLLSGTLVFGILPICIKPYLNSCQCSGVHRKGCATRKQRIATCFLIFFGGGVLLATCLVHLLYEARQGFEEVLAKCINVDVNSANYANASNTPTSEKQIYLQNYSETQMTVNPTVPMTELLRNKNISRPFQSVLEKEPVYDSVLCNSNMANTLFPLPEFITVCGFFLIYFVEEVIKLLVRRYQSFRRVTLHVLDIENVSDSNGNKWPSSQGHIRQLMELDEIPLPVAEDPTQKPVADNVFQNTKQDSVAPDNQERKKSANDLHFFLGQAGIEELNVEGLEDFITILALSFNSVFEGFAAGFQHTEMSTWMLFFSLALHKFVSAFVVSLQTLHGGGSNLRVSLYMILFSLMCPLGMMGAILMHRNLVESGSLQIGVLNALSVGTLLYVTFYEMLRQRKDFVEVSGFAQFFIILFGFIAMSTVEYFYTRVE